MRDFLDFLRAMTIWMSMVLVVIFCVAAVIYGPVFAILITHDHKQCEAWAQNYPEHQIEWRFPICVAYAPSGEWVPVGNFFDVLGE